MSVLSIGVEARPAPEPSFLEFVVIIAFMMALGSMSIDNLLPAFDALRADFGISSANEIQLVLTVYMAGFGVMQLFYGPVSDVIGRRPTLMIGLSIFAVGSVLALLAPNFETLLIARTIQGMGSAATRILSVAIVRDRYQGREMARVMSLTMMVFIIVPIFAPAIGSFFLIFGSWHTIFYSMLVLAVLIALWFGRRMPETLHTEYRSEFSFKRIAMGARRCLSDRNTVGYSTTMGLMFGALMGYLGSTQQIFETDVYGLGAIFPVVFGSIAAVMGVASFVNSRLVRRVGMRRLSHTGVVGFVIMSVLMVIVAVMFHGKPPLLLFAVMLVATQFLFSLTMPNFNAMAMESLGDIAGLASSMIGFYTTILGTVIGLAVGQLFDGTVLPLTIGFLSTGVVGLAVVFWTERGKLFSAHQGNIGAIVEVGH